MENSIPKSKWQRSMAGGKTAARVGGKVLAYWAKRPFLSPTRLQDAKKDLNEQSADMLFKAMSLLKGTALKVAQQLSLETDVFPEALRKELEKSYHQVPPINRALVRQVIRMGLGASPETLFRSFEDHAFAAASLGQVHQAVSFAGEPLAVKIQYPGIGATIESDLALVRTVLRPFGDYKLLKPAIDEIQARLYEEIDYRQELKNIQFFRSNLRMKGVYIPQVHVKTTADTIISTTLFKGTPLDVWLKSSPSQGQRDQVAQTLQDLFVESLYNLHCIHADPNPGNFLIADDLTVGLVDFGCVKHLEKDFVDHYAELPRVVVHNQSEAYYNLLEDFKMIDPKADAAFKAELLDTMMAFSAIFGEMYQYERFDFGKQSDFFVQLKRMRDRVYQLRHSLNMLPDFVFLDRTRYGLLRLFEQMQARVCFRNPHEWS